MKKLAFGIDIGGINTAFGLVDEKGDLYAESVISTKAYPYFKDYESYVNDLCDAMKTLADSVNFDFELIGIGIGAPNANYYNGTIETPANLAKFTDAAKNPDGSETPVRQRSFYPWAQIPTCGKVGFQGIHGGGAVHVKSLKVKEACE